MSILIVGSLALDSIQTPLGKRREILGGSAVYSAVSASLFHSPVNLVGVVGRDFPKRYIDMLKKKGIDLQGLEIKDGRTFRWQGEYTWNFNQAKTISTQLNVFAGFKPRIPQAYKNSQYVFLANIDPCLQEKVLEQVKKPKLVFCDTMNHWIEHRRKHLIKTFKKVDILLLNDSEARQLTGEVNMVKVARSIRKLGPDTVVIKLGENGALLFTGKHVFCLPGFLLESVVDPTGAGATFAGGFIGYLARTGKINQRVLREAVVHGSIMATFTVEDFSLDKLYKARKSSVNKRLKEFKKLTVF
jgi:sugar/nucleoside kinase (ribokinase family)